MSKLLMFALSVFCAPAFAMGPDPGGHTGAGVSPETTKTDQPAVDAARKATSGGKTENTPRRIPASPKNRARPSRGTKQRLFFVWRQTYIGGIIGVFTGSNMSAYVDGVLINDERVMYRARISKWSLCRSSYAVPC